VEEDESIYELNETVADVVRSARMIDVIGQILRNRAGSLLRPQLRDLAKSGYESGLKFLRFWLDITQRDQKDLISVIYESLKEEWRDELSNDVIPKAATRTYLALTYGVCFAVIRRIAYSLGSEELLEIFETLEKEDPDSVAIRMINVAIRLEFTKKIPKVEVNRLNADLASNPIGRRLLRQLMIEHLYLNHVSVEDKQWISDRLEIPMKSQRLIAGRKNRKK
jgi:hypothetical protein